MRWRIFLVALVYFTAGDVFVSALAYHNPTMNISRTEVLTGWACVWHIAFVVYPLVLLGCGVVGGLLYGALSWALKPTISRRG